MNWSLDEAIAYYQQQGAPDDQNALKELLREVQQYNGGQIPMATVTQICECYQMKSGLVLALIKRIPSLRLSNQHCLELCTGPNCRKHTALTSCAERISKTYKDRVEVRYVPCIRLCGKGPNIRWDGTLYHQADETLLQQLIAVLKNE